MHYQYKFIVVNGQTATSAFNSASARDICEIFASIGGFSGLGHRMLPTKFYLDLPLAMATKFETKRAIIRIL